MGGGGGGCCCGKHNHNHNTLSFATFDSGYTATEIITNLRVAAAKIPPGANVSIVASAETAKLFTQTSGVDFFYYPETHFDKFEEINKEIGFSKEWLNKQGDGAVNESEYREIVNDPKSAVIFELNGLKVYAQSS